MLALVLYILGSLFFLAGSVVSFIELSEKKNITNLSQTEIMKIVCKNIQEKRK